MNFAHCVTVRDPLNPWRHRDAVPIAEPAPIGSLAPETNRPFIILRNSEPVLRADWDKPIEAGDVMAIVMLPQGGDDSDVGQILAMIVVAFIAYYTGLPVAEGGLGYGSGAQLAVSIAGNPAIHVQFKEFSK